MIFSYAITVCNESKEFYELMCFLNKVVDFKKHELVVLLDTGKVTKEVYDVIDKFPPHKLFSRRFDGDFSTHRNFLIDRCNGDYIFMIDADEVPQQKLVENLENSTFSTTTSATFAADSKFNPSQLAREIAIEGKPTNLPSMAAATVPE